MSLGDNWNDEGKTPTPSDIMKYAYGHQRLLLSLPFVPFPVEMQVAETANHGELFKNINGGWLETRGVKVLALLPFIKKEEDPGMQYIVAETARRRELTAGQLQPTRKHGLIIKASIKDLDKTIRDVINKNFKKKGEKDEKKTGGTPLQRKRPPTQDT